MILFLSDLHCRFDVVNRQIMHAEERFGREMEAVVILGDVGMFEPFLRRFFRKRGETFLRAACYIEGNHEDYDRLPALIDRYADVMKYFPRGTLQCIGSQQMLCLGGAEYMDAMMTPPGAEIRQNDIERCLELPPDGVDLIVSHDCPGGIGITNQPGLEHYGKPGFEGGARLVEHFRPALWLFGHHHRWFDTTIEGTRFFGLPQSWCGYAVLDVDGELTAVEHEVEPEPVSGSRLKAFAGSLAHFLRH